MIEISKQYLNAGLSVLPARRSAKRPSVGSWKQYQQRLPTQMELNAWFSNPQDGICIITGAVSGNLEIIDFDNGGEMFDKWYQLVPVELQNRLVIEQTPSGGWHVIYRCRSAINGNMKLAQRKDGKKIHTLIETRGEGGLFLCAPTTGYAPMQGDLSNLSVLTEAEREVLLEAAWSLNEYIPEPVQYSPPGNSSTLRPGDDYNTSGDVAEILKDHGWQIINAYGDNQRWRRPDKTKGWSATLRTTDNVFFVFSTNAAPFESNKAYSPFMVYTLLEHGGDCRKAALALSKQGYGQPNSPPECDDVDISGIVCNTQDGHENRGSLSDPGPIPESYFHIPGFITQVMDFCLQTAPYPNRPLAFCGALALQAFLAGRKIKEPGGVRPNIYILALASSGTGKDWPRKINANVMNHVNALYCLGDRFASGEGIQDIMQANLNMLYQSDEIDGMIRTINQNRESRFENIMGTLLTFFSVSDSFFPVRTKAGMTESKSIIQPNLVLFGTATPKYYYEALNERMLTNGFFSRMLIVDVGKRPLCQMAQSIDIIPPDILQIAEYWQSMIRPKSGNNFCWENPSPLQAPYEGKAGQLLFDFQRRSDVEHQNTSMSDETARTVWTRAAENARKLALLYACSENHLKPTISERAVQWAIAFIEHQIKRQLYMAGIYAAENEFHSKCLKFKEKLRNTTGKQLTRSILLKRMKLKSKEFDEIVDTLLDQGDISKIPVVTDGRHGTAYQLTE